MREYIPLNDIYSLIYWLSALIFVLIGLYGYALNDRGKENRVFLYLCSTLFVWSLSFAFLSVASKFEVAVIIYRISVLGWGVFYSVLLHYMMIVSENQLLDNRKTYFLMYLPAVTNVFFYGIFPKTANDEFQLVLTSSGWFNTTSNSILDYFFYVYYILFTFLTFVVLLKWKKTRDDQRVKITAYMMIATILLGIVIGSVTDIILRNVLSETTPLLGVTYAIIPMIAVLVAIKRHGLMVPNKVEATSRKKEDVYIEKRYKFLKMLYIILVAGSLIYIAGTYFVDNQNLENVIFVGTIILCSAIYIRLIPEVFNQDRTWTFNLFILVLIANAALIVLQQDKSNATAWFIPILLTIILLLYGSTLLSVASLLPVFIITLFTRSRYTGEVILDNAAFLRRSIVLVFIIILINYINIVYRGILTKNEKYKTARKELTKVSTQFIAIDTQNIEGKVNELVEVANELLNTSFGIVVKYRDDSALEKAIDESQKSRLIFLEKETMLKGLGTLEVQHKQGEPVQIYDFETHLREHEIFASIIQVDDVKSALIVPIIRDNHLLGSLVFGSKKRQQWGREDEEALILLRNILADAWLKIESQNEITKLAYYDGLTGLFNRTMFQIQMEKILNLSNELDMKLGVMFLDLDDFKRVNDTLGHESGDILLQVLAKRIQDQLRSEDSICRFGGDEFLIMLPEIHHLDNIYPIAERVMSVFNEDVEIGENKLKVTASMGISVYPEDGSSVDALIKHADMAMYESKYSGKNKYLVCTDEMKRRVNEKIELTNDLHSALANNELLLMYQPQINVEKDSIYGFEALIRWQHPDRGLVSPGVFIPLAEQSGLINSIGEWVLREACEQNVRWIKESYGEHIMAVNISVDQLKDDSFADLVAEVLKVTHMPPKLLELEVTESVAIHETDKVIERLADLRAMGIAIAIDDFGTEYSSLSRLKKLPIDRLKLAMEFVHNIDKSNKDQALVKVIIELSRNMNLNLIAEGVETREELEYLINNGCTEIQGYYYFKPITVEAIESVMKEGDFSDIKI